MDRKDIIDFCNDRIFTQCRNIDYQGMIDTIKLVSRWRKGKNINVSMEPVVKDGFLFINGDKVGRIAPKEPTGSFAEESYYYEGRILAAHDL